MDPNTQTSTSPGASRTLVPRPGFVTFSGVMLLLIGGFEVAWALTEFANAAWLTGTVYGAYNGYLWIWAIVDIIFALVALYAGYDVLRGGAFGQIIGTLIVGLSAIRWFFLLPVLPLGAVIVIVIDVLILYGLLGRQEYFASRAMP